MRQGQKQNSGQILIESIVAIGIVSATLLAIVSLVTLTLRISSINTRKTIASNLAKETLEVLRMQRDNKSFFMQTPLPSEQYYRLNYDFTEQGGWYLEDLNTEQQRLTPTAGLYTINYNNTTALWSVAAETPAPTPSNLGYYYRQIVIQDYAGDANKKRVDVIISFIDRGYVKNVTYTTVLTGWKSDIFEFRD